MSVPFAMVESLQQDTEFWFQDGSIVLIAGYCAFKVHQGILSRHSDVFRDLFALPQPPDAEALFACPVLRMQDRPHQLRHLLRVLYDSRNYYLGGKAQIAFEELEALVLLAHKYHISDLSQLAIARLRTFFTDSWEQQLQNLAGDSSVLSFQKHEAIAVVNLAHVTGESTILPLALYHCCQLEDELVYGYARQDGTVEKLTREDLLRCIKGKAALAHREMLRWTRLYAGANVDCQNLHVCGHETRQELRDKEWDSGTDIFSHVPIITSIRETFGEDLLCASCEQWMVAGHQAYLRETWSLLPSYFGLGTWEYLRGAVVSSSP